MATSATPFPVWEHIVAQTQQNRMGFVPHILVDFLEGDTHAAMLLKQILYWHQRTADANGWFCKRYRDWWHELRLSEYQVRRIVQGDDRVKKKFKRPLWSVGIETEIRMAADGRNATYYRLNVEAFLDTFMTWWEQDERASTKNSMTGTDWAVYLQTWHPPTDAIQHTLDEQRERLGDTTFHAVLARCLQAGGNTWHYAVTALRNEPTPVPVIDWHRDEPLDDIVFQPEPAPPDDAPVSEPLPTSLDADTEAAWNMTLHDLKAKLGAQFDSLFGDLTLTAYDADTATCTFVTGRDAPTHVSHDPRAQRMLQKMLVLTLDPPQQPVTLVFLSDEAWRGQFRE